MTVFRLILVTVGTAACIVDACAGESSGLHNLIKVSERIYSGSEPANDAAFAGLVEMGIATVVSVDGARPDVDAAKAHGLQYVHIPIGYDSVNIEAQAAMAMVLDSRDGPIYIHCHHGKHRGPAMAAIAWLVDQGIDQTAAIGLLERAETSPDYVGLYESVRSFDPAAVDVNGVVLHETAPVATLAAEMAEISRIVERLQLCKRNDWQTPSGHDDISPQHEATMLAERLRELIRTGDHQEMDPEMRQSERLAWDFRDALRSRVHGSRDEAFRALRRSCRDCHKTFRN